MKRTTALWQYEGHAATLTSSLQYFVFGGCMDYTSRGESNIRHGCSWSKEPLRLIKYQNSVSESGFLKNGINVLGALSHPLTEQLTTVDNLQFTIEELQLWACREGKRKLCSRKVFCRTMFALVDIHIDPYVPRSTIYREPQATVALQFQVWHDKYY